MTLLGIEQDHLKFPVTSYLTGLDNGRRMLDAILGRKAKDIDRLGKR
jgi:hypothetical protein